VRVAALMATAAGASIPVACGAWSETMAAYRLLSNADIDPHAIQGPHREFTRARCAQIPVVLAISDTTDLDFTTRAKVRGLGRQGDGGGRGLQQHTTLAVDPCGGVIGVLRQHWFTKPQPPKGETRRQRQARWGESDVWGDAARQIGAIAPSCRVIHVADRGADVFAFLSECVRQGAGFLVRAIHDRQVLGEGSRLWEHAASTPVLGRMDVEVSAHRTGPARDRRVRRTARVALRAARVSIPPPVKDPRVQGAAPLGLHVVHVREEDPPAGDGVVPVEWMLLSSEPAHGLEDARRLAGWYSRRWVIEEFHRVEKEGCRLEDSQLDDAEDIKRLAAITAVLAVRLLQLRDAADPESPRADDPESLREIVPGPCVRVVAALTRTPAHQLTPRLFFSAVARRGGWLGRKGDGRPGWKAIWTGWREIVLMALGAQLMRPDSA
jgi:hypothetical protein